MKKVKEFLLAIMVVLAFAGCSKTEESTGKVYSFHGENEVCSVENGVIVVSPASNVFYGGDLEGSEAEFADITAYSTTFYVFANGEKRTLLQMESVDQTGGSLSINQQIGQITGGSYGDVKEEDLKNNLYFELETTSQNGETQNYQIKMDVVEVTKDVAQ